MIRRRYVLALDGLFVFLVLVGKTITGWMLEKGISPCFYLQYGLQCPACGGTRCLNYLTAGKVLRAFQLNPYVFCTVILSVGILVLMNIAVLSKKGLGRGLLDRIWKPRWLIVWAVGFAAFGILRNVPLLFQR